MPSTDQRVKRYPNRTPTALPAMIVNGTNLGPAMRPQDIFIKLHNACHLNDQEALDAFVLGIEHIKQHPDSVIELDPTQREKALAEAQDVTASRIMAWRKRNREMTWLELRVFLVGLKDIMEE